MPSCIRLLSAYYPGFASGHVYSVVCFAQCLFELMLYNCGRHTPNFLQHSAVEELVRQAKVRVPSYAHTVQVQAPPPGMGVCVCR